MRTLGLTIAATLFAVAATSGLALAAGKHKPGKCGEYMYYSMKKHKCMDSRSK